MKEKESYIEEHFFTKCPDLLCVGSLDGSLNLINEEWKKTLGYSIHDIKGKKYIDFIHPDDRPSTTVALEKIKKNREEITIINRFHHVNGTFLWFEWKWFFINDSLCASARQISKDLISQCDSENTENLESLKENEKTLRNIVSNLDVINFTLDKDGVFTLSEGKGLRLLGLSPGQLVGKSAIDVYGNNSSIIDPIKKCLRGESISAIGVVEGVYFDTRYTPLFNDDKTVKGVMGLAIDITDSIAVSQALRESERKFRNLFENLTNGFAMFETLTDQNNDIVAFSLIEANPVYKDIWDLNDSTLHNDTNDFLPFIDKQWKDDIIKMMNSEVSVNRTMYLPKKEKHYEVLEFKVDENHFATIFNDISNRRKTEQALRENELLFRNVVENLPTALATIDLSGAILFLNSAFHETTGYTLEDLPTMKRWSELAYPDISYRERISFEWKKDIADLIDGRITYSDLRVYHILTKSGRYIDMEITYRIIGHNIYAFMTDVTEKIRTVTEMKTSEQMFSDIYNLSPDLIGIVRISDGMFLSVNPEFSRLSGFTSDEIRGKTIGELNLWNGYSDREKIQELITSGKEIRDIEINVRIKNGKLITCLISAQPMTYNGEMCAIFVAHDITSRKIYEESLRKSEARLLRAQSMGHVGYAENSFGETYVWMSDEGLRIFGLKQSEGLVDLKTLEKCIIDFPAFRESSRLLIEKGVRNDIEIQIMPADGSAARYIHFTGEVEKDSNGKISKILYLFQDITERKKTEKIIADERNMLRAVIDNTPDLVYVKDLKSRFIVANKTVACTIGLTPEQLLGKTDHELFSNELAEDFYQTERELIRTGIPIINREESFDDTKGNTIIVQTTKIPLCDSLGIITGFVGTGHIITEQKKMQEALEKRVIALTRPIDDPEGIKFTDLFNLDELQELQDTFANATGVASIITYPDGEPITKPSNFCKLCSIIRETEAGRESCRQSDAFLGRHSKDGPRIQLCLSGGLWDAGSSITIGGKHMANWLIGQVRNKSIDEKNIIKFADTIGVSREVFIQALMKVPSMSEEQFEKISRALYTITNEISLKAYQNVQQARFIFEQNKAEEALRKSEAQFRGIAQNIPGVVFQCQIRDNNNLGFTYVSDLSNRYLGVDNVDISDYFSVLKDRIVKEDRPGFLRSIESAISDLSKWEWEGRFIKPDKTIVYVRGVAQPRKVENETVLDGVIFDNTERKIAEIQNKNKTERAQRQHKAIINLTLNKTISESPLSESFKTLTEIASQAIGVQRVGVWLLSEDESMLVCKDLYVADKMTHSDGFILLSKDYPGYFKALRKESRLNIKDAMHDKRTLEFKDNYFVPLGISSMLDAGIYIRGVLSGAVCLEHVGEIREWESDEEAFVSMLSSVAAEMILNNERKNALEALQKREAQFRGITQNIPGMVYQFHVSDKGEYSLNYVSDNSFIYTGLNNNDLSGFFELFTEHVHDEDRLSFMSSIDDAVKNFAKWNWEGRFNKSGGGERFFHGISQPRMLNNELVFDGVIFDITDLKNTETELSEKEAKLNSIYRAAPVGLGLIVDRIFVECNETFLKMTGYTSDEVIGRNSRFIYPTEEDYSFISDVQFDHMSAHEPKPFETHFLTKGKRVLDVILSYIPLDSNELSKGFIFSVLDISERKLAEEKIRMLNTELEKRVYERTLQLQQANRDLEAFAYSVSHDLRAPIRHIDGFVRLLYSKIEHPTETIVNYYSKIESASQRMSSMIESLLSFSRLGKKDLAMTNTDLNEMIREVIEEFRPDIEKRNITWNIDPLPTIRCDRNLLKMAFENLISNAIKYTSKKKKAIITIGWDAKDHKQFNIFIIDNGVGFDMAYAGKLFGVFQRLHTSDDFDGIGIGLANVRRIIEKHYGSIKAEGKLNKGAAFYITLPI